MKEESLELRMYGLVPYNISPIQQGIQYGHAVVEYLINFPADLKIYKDTKQWAEVDKTFIILNGGTTNKTPIVQSENDFKGSLNNHLARLEENHIKVATFYEPDLGDQLTAVVFLVDERVFDRETNPDFRTVLELRMGGKLELRSAISRILKHTAHHTKPELKNLFQHEYIEWCKNIGSEENVFLREFLPQFKLA